jgi:hypothetical protein
VSSAARETGGAKVINFAVADGATTYVLTLNTQEFSWPFVLVEESVFPSSYQPAVIPTGIEGGDWPTLTKSN